VTVLLQSVPMSRRTGRQRGVFAVIALLLATLPLTSVSVAEAAPPAGASRFVSIAPFRLAETRVSEGPFGFTRVSGSTIRVQVAGVGAVPANASAAVLNVTLVNPYGPGFVTVFPTGSPRPTASNLNADSQRRVIANMVTVKLGTGGAVDIFTNTPMDLVIDVSGAYVPVTTDVSAGRLETLAAGARRVIDTRDRGFGVGPGTTLSVDVAPAGVPTTASAVVLNVTAVDAAVGFFTVFPAGQQRPGTSTLNIDTVGQTRPGQAIVQLANGVRSVNVFSQNGGHVIVDVAGWFTGAAVAAASDGLFLPSTPLRMLDTRNVSLLAPWGGSTLEFFAGNPIPGVSAAAINITGIDPWQAGFVTAYPAGVPRPLASNLNLNAFGQIIANHAIVRVSSRGLALYTQNGVHLIADVAGWYLGSTTAASLPPPTNPVYPPSPARTLVVPAIDEWMPIETGPNLDVIADRGHAAAWGDAINMATPANVMLFGHRTTKGAPFRYIDRLPPGSIFNVIGADGRTYNYMVIRTDITAPNFNTINNIGLSTGPLTAQLIACHPPGKVTYRVVVTGRLISVT
jgi:LPXTG-site transpeptidase (sortase) family protein